VRRREHRWRRAEVRLAWAMIAPAVGTVAVLGLFPIVWTFGESLHTHDLRMPWLGTPFIGAANYVEAFSSERFRQAAAHTVFFAAVTVALELAGGLALALLLHGAVRARGLVRTTALLPWAIPTVVTALVWRFMFESPFGLATAVAARSGIDAPTWFASATAAWVPLIAADVWKMTPFVAILLLAGLQQIDPALHEAAAVDGAGRWAAFRSITLPLLRPALLVAFLFRTLDALRVFDVVYVMTLGGPGTATEPISLLTFTALLQNLRFGYASALSIIVFVVAFAFALATIRVLGGAAFLRGHA
jgi:ABC-type sugar transport system permease subunit